MKILRYPASSSAKGQRKVDNIFLTDFCHVRDVIDKEKVPFYEGKDLHLHEEPWCANCQRKLAAGLLCCSRCKVAWYCNSTCQKENYRMGHKSLCGDVARDLKRVEDEAAPLHNTLFADEPELQDVFETQVGFFTQGSQTHAYLNARRYLVETYIHASFTSEIKEVWEKALFHALALMRLDFNDPFGMKRMVPFFLLYLNRDDDTFDFVRFWLKAKTAEIEPQEVYDLLCGSPEGEWVYPRGKVSRYDDVFQEFPEYAKCKSIDFAFGATTGGRHIQEVKDAVKDMLTGNMYGDIDSQRGQIERLADIIHRNNPSMLPAYLNVRPILDQRRPQSHVKGEPSEIYDILNYSNSCFLRIPGAQDLLEKRFGVNPR